MQRVIGSSTSLGYSGWGTYLAPFLIWKNMLNESYLFRNIKQDNKYKSVSSVKKHSYNLSECINEENNVSLVIGGDHTTTLGSVQNSKADSLLWLDAHADYNNFQTTNTGNLHGMVISMILNDFEENLGWVSNNIEESNIILFGVRDFDRLEKKRIENSEIQYYTSDEVLQNPKQIFKEAYEKLGDNVHLSFDIDVLDPKIAPGVTVKSKGGFDEKTTKVLLEEINKVDFYSKDLVEYNILKDVEQKTLNMATKIAEEIL